MSVDYETAGRSLEENVAVVVRTWGGKKRLISRAALGAMLARMGNMPLWYDQARLWERSPAEWLALMDDGITCLSVIVVSDGQREGLELRYDQPATLNPHQRALVTFAPVALRECYGGGWTKRQAKRLLWVRP